MYLSSIFISKCEPEAFTTVRNGYTYFRTLTRTLKPNQIFCWHVSSVISTLYYAYAVYCWMDIILKVHFTVGLPLLFCSKHDNMHVRCYEGDRSMCQDGSEGKRQLYPCDNSNCYNTELTPQFLIQDLLTINTQCNNIKLWNASVASFLWVRSCQVTTLANWCCLWWYSLFYCAHRLSHSARRSNSDNRPVIWAPKTATINCLTQHQEWAV